MRRGLLAVDLEPASSPSRVGASRPEVVFAASIHVNLEALRVIEFGYAPTVSGGCIAHCIAPTLER